MLKKFKQFENNSSDIKKEVDEYMYSITDEYQVDSDADFSDVLLGTTRVIYKYIIVKKEDFYFFLKKLERVCKVIRKEFDLIENIAINKYSSKNNWLGGYDNVKLENLSKINLKNDKLNINYCRFTIAFFSKKKLNESSDNNVLKSIKDEVDSYMYSITDEYQSDNSKDVIRWDIIDNGNNYNISYKNIMMSVEDYNSNLLKLKNVYNLLHRDFNLRKEVTIRHFNEDKKMIAYEHTFIFAPIKHINTKYIGLEINFFGKIKDINYGFNILKESKEIPELKDYSNSNFYFYLSKRNFEESNYKKWKHFKKDDSIFLFDGDVHFATVFNIGGGYKGYKICSDGTIDDEFNRTDIDEIKKEVDEWMWSITDEYQNGSDEDVYGIITRGFQRQRLFYIEYENIILNKENKEKLIQKVKRVSDILKRGYNLSTYISTSKSKQLELSYEHDIDRLKNYNNAIIKITFQKSLWSI